MTEDIGGNLKLFVSYSWTSQMHEDWVIQFATELRENGIDAILDKWNLKEGHDAHAFMENMVTDASIKKVVLVCDKAYAEKANSRKGGVGTEAQIITPKIYESQVQDKFVAVVVENDEDGNPYLPAYYGSRIYIDLSDSATYAENFEKLLRWAYDQPLHVLPPLGRKPAYLSEEGGAVALGTSSRYRRAIDALINNRENAIPAVVEYFDHFAQELEKFRIGPGADPFDEAVVQNIDAFLPYRNEVVEIFLKLALYRDTDDARIAVHRFFERLLPYMDRPPHVQQWGEGDFDNFKFIVHELFIYAIASMIRHGRFKSASYLMANEYFIQRDRDYGANAMVSFVRFRPYLRTLEFRNQRLELRRLSVHADMLKERCKDLDVEFRHIMQADFILFIRSCLQAEDEYPNWWPITLLYADHHHGAFEIFARSRSTSYFECSKTLLGIDTKDDLVPLLEQFRSDPNRVPRWQHNFISPARLLGFEELASRP